MNWDAFFTVHFGLHWEGPRLPEDVAWKLSHLEVPPVCVLDATCGPGADTETLAQMLPDAQITAVEAQAQFVTETQARCIHLVHESAVSRATCV